MKLTRVLEAKWREFDSSNPFTKKDDLKDGAKSSESSTGVLQSDFYHATLCLRTLPGIK